MFFRKYLAFFESVHPWTFCCLCTWWVDRLFVEFGHRQTSSPICIDTELQYVRLHQYITVVAFFFQSCSIILKRRLQFKRELALVDISDMPCICHIYVLNMIMCISWTIILCCIVDVSPWLCVEQVTKFRASMSLVSILSVGASVALERVLWEKTLSRAVDLPVDI
jgi:hypothetical protein